MPYASTVQFSSELLLKVTFYDRLLQHILVIWPRQSRVRDRANPVRSITLYEDKYGEGDEADGPLAGRAIKVAQRFHALLTQIVEEEGSQRTASCTNAEPERERH